MDVRCERCSTEYEFDDALVSGRGTTVKCTNCGHKFKIRRQDGDYSEDFWNVTTGDGRTLVFTSLRELQRAIQTHLVERNDKLSRGGLPPKAIGQIPELMPFFDQREREKKSLPPPAEGPASLRTSRPPPPPGAAGNVLAAPPRQRQQTKPEFPSPPPTPEEIASMRRTLIGGAGATPEPSPQPAAPAMRRRMSSVPPPLPAKARSKPPAAPEPPPPEPSPSSRETPRVNAVVDAVAVSSVPSVVAASPADAASAPAAPAPAVDVPSGRGETPAPAAAFEASSPLPAPTAPALRKMLIEVDDTRGRGPSPSLPDAPTSMGRRRSVGGFIVVTVLLLGVGLIAMVWARDHLGPTLGGTKPVASTTKDPRVATHLAAGDKALADGDLDLARDSYVKASALGEREPAVLLAMARLAAARADVPWLEARLLPDEAKSEQQRVRASLDDLASAAKRAADDALAVAPDDASALRAKIDALRIAGDSDGARALVSRIAATASQPEGAYVLAALDLAESQPLWSTVVERLRVAAGAEVGPGRARAALVYALARSGDVAAARAELGRLEGMPRRTELLPYLKAFVDRQAAAPSSTTDAGAHALDASAAAIASGGKPEVRPGGGGGDHGTLPTDPRVLVARGEEARQKGDLDRAHTMFSAALDKNGSDTEALSGLAAVAYARRDLPGARASYKRVLSVNPSYVPALVGVADCDWESGDRGAAMKTYKEIVDRFPEGTYPGRVKMRLESGAPPSPPAPAPPPPAPSAAPPAPAPAPAPSPPTESQ